jgi:predicted RecA/RadA family phage recombinase
VLTYKSTGERVEIPSAASAFTAGVPILLNGWAGVPVFSGQVGERAVLAVEGVFEVNHSGGLAGATLGAWVYMTDADSSLSLTPGAGKRLFAKVVAVPGAGETGTYGKYPPVGKCWIKLQPQAVPA